MQPNRKTLQRAEDPLKVSPVTVQAQTVTKLREAILMGVFKPAERLVETDLCQRMEVSRPSVREALRRLEAERLVTIIPNRGPSVTEISWEQAKQIYEVRSLLEGEAAALFAARATPADVEALGEALRDFEKAVVEDDALERLSTTSLFYDIILQGCGNNVIAEILQGLLARINFLRARSMSRAGRARKSAAEMRKILTAIKTGDVAAARRAAVQHVHAACRAARNAYMERGSRA